LPHALIDNTMMHSRGDARRAPKRDAGDSRYREKHLCRSPFRHSLMNDRRAVDVIATDRGRLKARFADSESRFLAIKKFSCEPAWRRLGARQNRFFGRIAAADSRGAIFLSRCSASL
jgi:hypothetical protein